MRFPGRSAPVDWLVVGLGNPGARYDGTPHNVGFQVVEELPERWDLGRAKDKFGGRFAEGRAGIGGPARRGAAPQTFMNESGKRSARRGAR